MPLACWRLEAARFDFDSSVIRPDAEAELTLLAGLYDKTGGAALSVFGHADPVGDDEYNKALSGRRTKAVYGLLTRDTAMWSGLASSEAWPQAALTMMQTRTGKPAGTARDELFRAYMDAICHRADGSPFIVDKSGFLGRGLDAGGKADYQGCSEFNPILRFSSADEQALSAPARKARARRAQRAQPARAGVHLPGRHVRAGDGVAVPARRRGTSGCRAQFWPDGDTRRAAQATSARYERDKNTFACAFYDRMARRSPCELLRKTLRIRCSTRRQPLRREVSAGDRRGRRARGTASGNAGDSDDERRLAHRAERAGAERVRALLRARRLRRRGRTLPFARSSSSTPTTRTTRPSTSACTTSATTAATAPATAAATRRQRCARRRHQRLPARLRRAAVAGSSTTPPRRSLRAAHDDGVPPERRRRGVTAHG